MEDSDLGNEPIPFTLDTSGGLWAATLEDAGEVTIVLKGNVGRDLAGCVVQKADRDALLVTTRAETFLIPTSSVSYVKFRREHWLGKAFREHREQTTTDAERTPTTMPTQAEDGES